MKIAVITPASLPATQFGGILFLGLDIAKEASRKGHDVTIYSSDLDFANNAKTFNKKLPRSEKYENFLIKRSHVWFSISHFFVNPGIYFQILKDSPDVIHTIGIRSFQSIIAALVSKKKNIPLVISDQGGLTTHPAQQESHFLKRILFKIQKPIIKFIINQATKISVANEYEKEIFSELCNASKIVIIRNGINLDIINSVTVDIRKKYSIDDSFVLFLGRFDKIKGIDLLLQAIHLIKEDPLMSKTKLVIMGVDFGFESQMFSMIDKLNIKDKVVVIKNPPREDVISAYKESKFLVLPSRWELSPLTPLEGFAFKKAVISTKTHGIPYTITNGKHGILVDHEDFNALSKAILELLRDEQKCIDFGLEGYKLVQETCNSKIMVKNTLKIYHDITNR